MQLLKEWPPNRSTPLGKRKRAGSRSIFDEDRGANGDGRKKSSVADDESRAKEGSAGVNDENTSLLSPSSLHAEIPSGRDALPSPPIQSDPNQSIHPAFHSGRVLPLSPLSRSPEHNSEQPLTGASHHTLKSADGSRQSVEQREHSKRLQIDTTRAISNLDPRSPGYGMASKTAKDEHIRQHQRKASYDGYGPHSNPPSRRQSQAMPHPISATGKDSHSEISTPKSASAPKLTSSTNPTASSQGPLIINFSSLAESVVLASSVNVKLDNIKDSAVQSESEHRRNQKYNAAYHSLVDRSGLRHEASQKAKIRLSNQFESLTKNQRDIASRLDNPETQVPAPITSNTDTKESIQNIIEEIAKVRKEVQAFQIALDDQKREWLSKSDFDRYSSKAVNHNDLAQLVNRKDFLTVEERLTTRGSDITNLEGKLSDLAVVTQDRHREGQGTQQQNMTRFEGHGTSISNAQKQQSQLKTTLDAQKADFDVHTADLQKLQESLSSLKQVVHGDPDNNELGLILSSENNTNKLAQSIVSADDLAVRIQKLEEAIHEKDRQQSSIPPAVQPGFLGEIAALRQDFDRLGEEQKGEYTIIAEAIDKLETGLKESQEHIARLEETAAKQNTQLLAPSENSTDPPQADSPAITNNLDHVKLEQLETDIKALNTHLVVQKKQFDNLTTEHLAKSIINQMKQLYKEHPGHVQDKLRTIEGRQGGIEAYLTQNLEPRLATMQAHLNGRATNDEVQTLSRRNQILEENINQTYEHAAKSGKDLSDKIDVVKDEVARHEKGLDDIRQSAILKSETITQRLDGLQGDVEILNQEAYFGTATDSTKQDLLRRSLKYQNRICLPENAVETRHPKSLESNEASISGGQAGSMSSSRDNSVMSRLSGAASRSADDSSGPSINNKRKRQSYKSVLDSESDNEHSTAPKVSRRTETA